MSNNYHQNGAPGSGNRNSEGFILYNLNLDGPIHDINGNHGHGHGQGNADSRSSIPSQYSALSGSQYSAGGSSARQGYPGSGRAPPPHAAILRTNFTTQQSQAQSPQYPDDSPSEHAFHHFTTPQNGNMLQQEDEIARQFREVALLQQQQKQAAPSSNGQLIAIMASIVVGTAIGMGLSYVEMDPTISQWIKMPGDMYIRALQCVVIPLVFVNLAVSVADIVHLGQSRIIGFRVAVFFFLITVLAVIEGVGMGYLSSVVLNLQKVPRRPNRPSTMGIQCGNGLFLQELADGMVTCTAAAINSTAKFEVTDVNNVLVKANRVLVRGGSLTANLIDLLHHVVPENIARAFVENIQLNLVAFAIPCGVVMARSFHGPVHLNPLLELLREVNETLLVMTNYVIRFTPFAVLCLLSGSFGEHLEDVINTSPIQLTLSLTSMYVLAVMVHMLIVLPILFVMITHSNPFAYMRNLIPAYVYSLGCSSSIATLPVSLRCVEKTRQIADSVLYFVMSAGCSLHMNGTAIYLPMMVFFIVELSDLSGTFGTLEFIVLCLASLLGAFAASPVPSGSLVMVTTVWRIALPKYPLPDIYAFLVACDVILDRFVTMANINGDAMVCRMVAEQVNEQMGNFAGQQTTNTAEAI